jgi:tetratricopeptide (TPR) repeat protein
MTYGALASTELLAHGRFEEALARTAEEARTAPDEPEILHNKGLALAGLGRLEEAVDVYAAALAMDAGDSAMDADALDDDLFDALRELATQESDVARATAWVERYGSLLPGGRHLTDVALWRERLAGAREVWRRERAEADEG